MTPNSNRTPSLFRTLIPSKSLTTALGLLFILLLLMLALPSGRAAAAPVYMPTDMLVASNYDTVSGAHSGTSVSVSGDTAVVGAPDENGSKGAVYVYVRPSTGWTNALRIETVELTAGDIVGGAEFGSSVSISGDTIVVGARADDGNKGAAYVFVRPSTTNGWSDATLPTYTYAARLTEVEANRAAGDFFGESVAISGDTIVVGRPGDQGAAYVFIRPASGWTTATANIELSSSEAVSGDYFGGSVATHGDTVVVGAKLDDVGQNGSTNENQGSAFLFVEPAGGWATTNIPTGQLTASNGAANDLFGGSVAIREDSKAVVVGAQGATPLEIVPDAVNPNQGAAYVFMRPKDGWESATESAILSSGDTGTASDLFGHSVAISGDTIVVGAFQYGPAQTGAAFVYVQPNVGILDENAINPKAPWESTATATAVLTAGEAAANGDQFAYSVATSGGSIIAGVPMDDIPSPAPVERPQAAAAETEQGSAYVFMNGFCSAQSGNWSEAGTWVGPNAPSTTDDVCISTGHIVTLDAAAEPASVGAESEVGPIRRLLINPGAELNFAALDIYVTELVTNNGKMSQVKSQNTIGEIFLDAEFLQIYESFGGGTRYLGVNVDSASDLGEIVVTLRETIDWFSPTSQYQYCTSTGPDSPVYTQRCFTITPATSAEATITLWGLEDELNGIDVADLAGFRFVGGAYEELGGDYLPATPGVFLGYVWAKGDTTGFSSFILGKTLAIPTAVTMIGMAVSDELDVTAVLLAGVVFLALAGLGLLVRTRRKTT